MNRAYRTSLPVMSQRLRFHRTTCCVAVVLFPMFWSTLQAQVRELQAEDVPRQRVTPSHKSDDAPKHLGLAPGLQAEIYAAEPWVRNPLAFTFDPNGHCLVCESFRQGRGVEDNRQHPEWLEEDLQSQTVEDRIRMLRKHLGAGVLDLEKFSDRIRMLQDRNQDGRADRASVFATGFNSLEEGSGASVLAIGHNVYYTCIPRLWAFRDDDQDGQADRRATLLFGFGVRVSLRGHDLKGLRQGPDGRLYFCVGDRGYQVRTDDAELSNAESGAIFRCEQDGTLVEQIASGFRNPSDLVFDEYGNLFTADSGSMPGEPARWIHVLPGMDAGWRMAFQSLPDRGPWLRERLSEPRHPEQPAYIYPPIANLDSNPTGLEYYRGTGLGPNYVGNFFMGDLRDDAARSGLHTFKLVSEGASFRLIDTEILLWNCLATDVSFGPLPGLYVSDWIESGTGSGKGRIYRLFIRDKQVQERAEKVQQLLYAAHDETKGEEWLKLLEHPTPRVRELAQQALVQRGAIRGFTLVLQKSSLRVARLHAIWGLSQIARLGSAEQRSTSLEVLSRWLRDPDHEIRAAIVRVFGEIGEPTHHRATARLLGDPHPKVKCEAALAMARAALSSAVAPLTKTLIANAGVDPALRHAAIMGLARCATEEQLASLHEHPSLHLRLAAVVALRRQRSPQVAIYLDDQEPQVATEAALAIHDEPIPQALEELAKHISRGPISDPFVRRALNANYRLGLRANAEALGDVATDDRFSLIQRQLALKLLASWDQPHPRDVVLGMWRPVEGDRAGMDAVQVLRDRLPKLLDSGHELRTLTSRVAAQLGIPEAAETLEAILQDPEKDPRERAGALLALADTRPPDLRSLVDRALQDSAARVRAAARFVLVEIAPQEVLPVLQGAIDSGEPIEQQAAVERLAFVQTDEADAAILDLLQRLRQGQLAPHIQLDVLMAARRRAKEHEGLRQALMVYDRELAEQGGLAPYHVTLQGGDIHRGRQIFHERVDLGCLRCHAAENSGGNIGPELTAIADSKSPQELLESIVTPHAKLAAGFETVVISTKDGERRSGIVKKRTKRQLHLQDAEGRMHVIDRDQIQDAERGDSLMPSSLIKQLSPYDLRDLLAYLSSLRNGEPQRSPPPD